MARLRGASVPVVNVSSKLSLEDIPSVVCNDEQVGRLGAEHFIRRGFGQFIFYKPVARNFAQLRAEGFRQRIQEANLESHEVQDRASLDRILYEIPKPVAVMGCNDIAALAALDLCRVDGFRVPDEVAVLGVDNDEVMLSLASPPLSSVNPATERIGFEAAMLLERLMNGSKECEHLVIPPAGVVTRQSTDLIAVTDRDVAEAVRFIRSHAGTPIGVDDVLKSTAISRRQLERRFRATLGRSVLDEIRRCRVDRARQLLTDTDLTIPQIATASGFSTASYLTVVFREETGITPGAFRDQYRNGRAER